MFHRIPQVVLLVLAPLLSALPAMADNPFQQAPDTGSATQPDKKHAADLKEVDLYQLGNVVEKETIYLAAGGGGNDGTQA